MGSQHGAGGSTDGDGEYRAGRVVRRSAEPLARGEPRDANQAKLLADADIANVREIQRNLEDPLHQLHRGLVRHPGAPTYRGGRPVPSVHLERRLDLVEVAAVDAGYQVGQADFPELVG